MVIPRILLLAAFLAPAWAQTPFTVAHRGGMARQPQNTLAAFRNAVRLGVDVLEFDLVPTRDNRLAVIHDLDVHSPLCTLPGGGAFPFGPVRALPFDDLRRLDCGSWRNPRFPLQETSPGAKIPSFEEVLEAFPDKRIRFLVETKMAPDGDPRFVDPGQFASWIAREIQKHGAQDRVILQSGDYRTLDAMKREEPRVKICLVNARRFKPDYLPLARRHQADYLMLGIADTTAEQVRELRGAGFRIVSNVIDDVDGWRKALDMGMDGLMTDDPVRLLEFVRSANR